MSNLYRCDNCSVPIHKEHDRIGLIAGSVCKVYCVKCYRVFFGLGAFEGWKDSVVNYSCHSCNKTLSDGTTRMVFTRGVTNEMRTVTFHPRCFKDMCTTSFLKYF
jgi:hypothetical protein